MSNKPSAAFIIEITVGLAVVAGAILVAYELYQARSINRANVLSEQTKIRIDHNIALMGENPAAVWAKGCTSYEELTPEEATIYHAMIENLRLMAERPYLVEYFADLDYPWQLPARAPMATYLGTPLGRVYLNQEGFWSDEHKELANSISPIPCEDVHEFNIRLILESSDDA